MTSLAYVGYGSAIRYALPEDGAVVVADKTDARFASTRLLDFLASTFPE